ncbi:MAG TPA: M14 family metallopeptidase, partial [Longimicrobiales bacterium]
MTPASTAAEYFSVDYASARARFRASAREAGAVLHALALDAKAPEGTDLTIDIAWLGQPGATRFLLHSSGLHGVEAFTGSAVQLALLAQPPEVPADCALVLVHVLNPYGMAWLRRTNENNVDLNRNFLAEDEHWRGAPELYDRIDPILNPPTPPGRDFFYLRALWQTWRHGFRPLKQAVARGQYEYPRGLFFGGRKLEQGPRLYLDWLQRHLTRAQYVFALDLHTGLGRWGEDTLLLEAGAGATPPEQLSAALDHPLVDVRADPGVAYEVRGGMG